MADEAPSANTLVSSMQWDEEMLEATLEGFDGDLAQTRSFLEQQAA